MKIYTRSGDQGMTSLFGGERLLKNEPQLEAYGTCDELNSVLGLLISELSTDKKNLPGVQEQVQQIQHELFLVGSHLACGDEKMRSSLPSFDPEAITTLETWIDNMDQDLPSLTQFILPGGTKPSAYAHLARTVCRRFERRLLFLEPFDDLDFILKYSNRLSDALFTLARYINFKNNHPETSWVK